jgi:hypothetical protein
MTTKLNRLDLTSLYAIWSLYVLVASRGYQIPIFNNFKFIRQVEWMIGFSHQVQLSHDHVLRIELWRRKTTGIKYQFHSLL